MTEGQAVETPKKRKGLLAFYIAMGFVALLFVGFYFAWTPLNIWYWERRVRVDTGRAKIEHAKRLANLGPAATAAFGRLLRDSSDDNRIAAGVALGNAKCKWALPMLADVSREQKRPFACVMAAEDITEMEFGVFEGTLPEAGDRQYGKRFLAWWESEGRAKYGSGGD